MTPEQFAEFLNFVNENNAWGPNMYDTCRRNRIPYKYIEATWDSRDNTVFAIKLRRTRSDEGKVIRVDTPDGIENIYNYLEMPLREEPKYV